MNGQPISHLLQRLVQLYPATLGNKALGLIPGEDVTDAAANLLQLRQPALVVLSRYLRSQGASQRDRGTFRVTGDWQQLGSNIKRAWLGDPLIGSTGMRSTPI